MVDHPTAGAKDEADHAATVESDLGGVIIEGGISLAAASCSVPQGYASPVDIITGSEKGEVLSVVEVLQSPEFGLKQKNTFLYKMTDSRNVSNLTNNIKINYEM